MDWLASILMFVVNDPILVQVPMFAPVSYPNPCNKSCTVRLYGANRGRVTVKYLELVDINGGVKENLLPQLQGSSGDVVDIPLDMSTYDNGIYAILVDNGQSRSIWKIMKTGE